MNTKSRAAAQAFADLLGEVIEFPTNRGVALDLAERGLAVFPIRDWGDSEGWKPIAAFPSKASADPRQIERWWNKWPEARVGLVTGARNGLMVLDIDEKNGKSGSASLAALGFDDLEALSPCRVRTPSGGWHLFFTHDPALKNSVSKIGDGVDLKTEGGYVVAPGSWKDSRQYKPEGEGITRQADLPALPRLLALRSPTHSKNPFEDLLGTLPVADASPWQCEWARRQLLALARDVAGTPEGERYSRLAGAAFWAGGVGASGALTFDETQKELTAAGAACGLSPQEVGRAIARSWENGLKKPVDLPPDAEDDFEDVSAPEGERAADGDKIERFNQRHAIVALAGKTRVIRETPDGLEFWAIEELAKIHAHDRVKTPGGRSTEPFPAKWFKSPRARRYIGGVTFNPAGAREDQYNLWRGWAAEPDASASCALFLDHLRTIVCGGNDGHYQWLLAWMAQLVQQPNVKPGTALVLRGAKGAGKDTVGRYLGALCPQNHVTLAQPEHLTGRFNGHMAQALLLHLEEGFWAGDKAGESVLKNLITAETLQIERKGIDPVEMPSFARLLITSNADWVVPATRGERRFFVLNVSDARAKDTAYFANIAAELRNGGGGALMHLLRHFDMSGFDLRNPPETEALTEQKLKGLRNLEAWWHERLYAGRIGAAAIESDDIMESSPEWSETEFTVNLQNLHREYEEWMQTKRFHGDTIRPQDFGKKWRELIPNTARDYRKRDGSNRIRCVVIPPLCECRASFSKHIGGEMSWD